MVECDLAKVEVAGSNPVFRSNWPKMPWRNVAGASAAHGMRVLLNGKAPAFQAGHVGSIPITRSK